MPDSPLSSESQHDPNNDRPRTPWAVHVVCYVLLSGLLIYVLVGRYAWPLVLRDGIGVEPGVYPAPASGEFASKVNSKIDPNVATWSELATCLPGVGEITAKKIVAFREQTRRAGHTGESAGSGSPVVFSCPEDLQAVPGIGPKTATRIAPYLVFFGGPASRPTD